MYEINEDIADVCAFPLLFACRSAHHRPEEEGVSGTPLINSTLHDCSLRYALTTSGVLTSLKAGLEEGLGEIPHISRKACPRRWTGIAAALITSCIVRSATFPCWWALLCVVAACAFGACACGGLHRLLSGWAGWGACLVDERIPQLRELRIIPQGGITLGVRCPRHFQQQQQQQTTQ